MIPEKYKPQKLGGVRVEDVEEGQTIMSANGIQWRLRGEEDGIVTAWPIVKITYKPKRGKMYGGFIFTTDHDLRTMDAVRWDDETWAPANGMLYYGPQFMVSHEEAEIQGYATGEISGPFKVEVEQ